MVCMSNFVVVCEPLKYTVENDGRDGAFELAGAGNTGKEGTFEMVCMSDFCGGLHAPQIHSGERTMAMAGTVLLSSRMLKTLARTALLFTAVLEELAGTVLFATLDMLDVYDIQGRILKFIPSLRTLLVCIYTHTHMHLHICVYVFTHIDI